MKCRIKLVSQIILAMSFLVSAILGYYKDVEHMWEYCFVSGVTVGAILLISAIYEQRTQKPIPEEILFSCVIDITIILVATAAIGLNLEGAFWFIHIINPIMLLLFWSAFGQNGRMKSKKNIMVVLIFPLLYLFVSFVRMNMTGLCAFPANMILRWTPQVISVPIILVLSIIILLLACILKFVSGHLLRR